MATHADGRSIVPSIILGLGLGGFVDGIVLHQLAQWHNMGSAVIPPVTMDAMSRRRPTPAAFTGFLLLGWGVFNLVEGVIDHHLLEINHVRDMPMQVPAYDWAFQLVGGAGFILAGLWLSKERTQQRP